jgi:Protein of unknown function (DUF2905)
VSELGGMLIFFWVILAAMGAIMLVAPRIPWLVGKLPGDITYRGKNVTFYFPLATSILLSVVLSWILYLFRR